MSSLRFLLSRRWVLFALVVGLLAYLAWVLGQWQFDRLEERQDRNALIERNEQAPPVPPGELMPVGDDVAASDEWRTVTATGTYAVEDTVIVRYRTRDGAAGVEVVVPLVTADGTALLVDRGWLPTDNRGTADPDDVPAPPQGEVTVTGWVRVDATGDSSSVTDQSTRAISSDAIGEALDREVYGGFVELREESPAPAEPLAPAELPELDSGPHFFYGLQWWFFGLLALVGFGYLAWDEWRKRPGRGSRPGATTGDGVASGVGGSVPRR
ncbi:SURF1 family protein [Nocardioides sp. GCM10027113]|uniref:SURF1 family cytochrome oxidase biogenesis protein n=1 Tax=unclassified Nocardioides TaxID=2615069 RepID=UPI0036129CA3